LLDDNISVFIKIIVLDRNFFCGPFHDPDKGDPPWSWWPGWFRHALGPARDVIHDVTDGRRHVGGILFALRGTF
jgi:hypothetical protein